MSAVEPNHDEPGVELVPHGLARLQRRPIIETVDEKTLGLIASQIAQGCNRGEIGHFLELCAHYDLDPFAKEAWCAKSKTGKLLIMVGRDGLRKIAHRQDLRVDGDVVRAEDFYEVEFIDAADYARPGEWEANGSAPFHRVSHKHNGMGKQRGDIVGAWCRVKDPAGRERGWFEAPIEEYKPSGASDYSPWSKQVGVMILAAAERQALRQATPLGGLLAEGEDATVFDAEVVTEHERFEDHAVGVPIDEHEQARIRAMLDEVDWPPDETALQLAAAGVADISDLEAAISGLTWPQAERLTAEMNAVLDSRDVAGGAA